MSESSITGPVQFLVDNFWINHKEGFIYIDFHSELRTACDEERKFSIDSFKSYLQNEESSYLSDYLIPETEDDDIDKVFWFEALENVKHWQVEGFLNLMVK